MPSQVFLLMPLRSESSMFAGIVYTEKYFIITDGNQLNVVLMAWDAWTWCTHILAFQALKFWKNMRQSTNRKLYNTFVCFRRDRDNMSLLRTYLSLFVCLLFILSGFLTAIWRTNVFITGMCNVHLYWYSVYARCRG